MAASAALDTPLGAGGRIGPNALTQLLPLLVRAGGTELRDGLLAEAGVFEMPDMSGLIDEAPVARLHQAMRAEIPDLAPALAWEAGVRTADYIVANRIPRGVRGLLAVLPRRVGTPILAQAIARNAWTFAGSGRFEVERRSPPVFLIHDNPVVRGEFAAAPICQWHAGVFERLFRRLVDDRYRAEETACCACGARACRFEVRL